MKMNKEPIQKIEQPDQKEKKVVQYVKKNWESVYMYY